MTNVTYVYFKSKDEEQAFLMTGNDIGFTQWNNKLKEALLLAPITLRQYKIFDAIHRLTAVSGDNSFLRMCVILHISLPKGCQINKTLPLLFPDIPCSPVSAEKNDSLPSVIKRISSAVLRPS